MTEPRERQPLRTQPFRPRFTITLLYLFGIFVLYALAVAAPALHDVYENVPPGPRQQEMARQASQEALHAPRIWIVAIAALATTALGARLGLLPGTRSDP